MDTFIQQTDEERQRYLREKFVFHFGAAQSMETITAWIEFIETGKITSAILLSAAEHRRMEELRKLYGLASEK